MERVAIYLRKSRADIEAEARGEGETLAKHKKALLGIAKERNLNIINIRQEVVSGESLIHRPEMMELLKEVEGKKYDAVLVMDVDRLGRGNMKEQGLILETFRSSKTKIITPRKVYDLQDEFDEEYSEFEAFMARKELKMINRRLQSGRIRSVKEGNFTNPHPPYGYQVQKDQKGRYLVPHPDQASVVQMIFELYTSDDPTERIGTNKIAKKLDEYGYLSYTGGRWRSHCVNFILKNAVYTGRIQWKKIECMKSSDPLKKRETRTRPRSEWVDVKGKHEPLISEEVFLKAQSIMQKKYNSPYPTKNDLTNPLAGIIRCGVCGKSIVRRSYEKQRTRLVCYNRYCENRGSVFEYVEQKVLSVLEQWLNEYKLQWEMDATPTPSNKKVELYEATIKNLHQELKNLETQKGRLHDLLERGIYDEDTYLERSQHIANRMNEIRGIIGKTTADITEEKARIEARTNIIPKIENVIHLYKETADAKTKNILLKSVLDHCEYKKEKEQRGDQFTLRIFPII